MIPGKKFTYMRGDDPIDEKVHEALTLIDQQFKELLNFSTRIALGPIKGGGKLQNLNAFWIQHTFGGVANTDELVSHPLKRVPVGLINVETPSLIGIAPVSGVVSFGGAAATSTQATVRCTAASKLATFILF